jgi:copper resistance protein B
VHSPRPAARSPWLITPAARARPTTHRDPRRSLRTDRHARRRHPRTLAPLGFDYDKLWWKSEGENAFAGPDEGEAENDLLYSRLISPFWNAQVGAQYANEWEDRDHHDRWSGVVALQGLAPGTFEIDASLYLSEDADLTAEIEAEYDLRITQRLVFQPRVEMAFAALDVEERDLGAGLTGVDFDLRRRYEVRRELAPYVGLRYGVLVGETGNIAERTGRDDQTPFFLAGVRLAF